MADNKPLPLRLPYGQRYNRKSDRLDAPDAKGIGFRGPLSQGDHIVSEYSSDRDIQYPSVYEGISPRDLGSVLMHERMSKPKYEGDDIISEHLNKARDRVPFPRDVDDRAYEAARRRMDRGQSPFFEQGKDKYPAWSPDQQWEKPAIMPEREEPLMYSTGGAMKLNLAVDDALRVAKGVKNRKDKYNSETRKEGGQLKLDPNAEARKLIAEIDKALPSRNEAEEFAKGGKAVPRRPAVGSDEYWAERNRIYAKPYGERLNSPDDPRWHISPEEYKKGYIGRTEYVLANGGRAGYADGGQPTDDTDPTRSYVQSLYQNIMGRPAEQGGLDYWTQQLNEGTISQEDALQAFTKSNEFQSLYKQDPNKAVSALYQTALGRAPEQGGLDYWTQQAKQGLDLGQMVSGFTGSDEGQTISGINSLYQQYTGKNPTKDQIAQSSQFLNQGGDFADLERSVAESDEATNYNNTQFINSEYQGLLGRKPTKNEFNSAMDQLKSGNTDYATFDKNLSDTDASQEYQASNFDPYQVASSSGIPAKNAPRTPYQFSMANEALIRQMPLEQQIGALLQQEGEGWVATIMNPKTSQATKDQALKQLEGIANVVMNRAAVGLTDNNGTKKSPADWRNWFGKNDPKNPTNQILAPSAFSAMKLMGNNVRKGYSDILNAQKFFNDPNYQPIMDMVKGVTSQSRPDITGGATHYKANYVHPAWARSKGGLPFLTDLGGAPGGKGPYHQYYGSKSNQQLALTTRGVENGLNATLQYASDEGATAPGPERDPIEAQIKQINDIYQKYLHQAPSQQGLDNLLKQLGSGKVNMQDIDNFIKNSNEAKTASSYQNYRKQFDEWKAATAAREKFEAEYVGNEIRNGRNPFSPPANVGPQVPPMPEWDNSKVPEMTQKYQSYVPLVGGQSSTAGAEGQSNTSTGTGDQQPDLFTQAWQKYQSDYNNWKAQADAHRMIAAMTGSDPNLPWHLQVSMPQPPNRADYPAGGPSTGIAPNLTNQGAGGNISGSGMVNPNGAPIGATGLPNTTVTMPPQTEWQPQGMQPPTLPTLNDFFQQSAWAGYLDPTQGGANIGTGGYAGGSGSVGTSAGSGSVGSGGFSVGFGAAKGGVVKPDDEDVENALRIVRRKGGRINTRIDKDPDFDMSVELASGGRAGAWTRKEGQNPEGGLNAKGRASAKAEGSNLKPPAPHPKTDADAARRKSFCARMKGMKAKLTSSETANDPDSRINKSLRVWNCHSDGGAVDNALRIAKGGKIWDKPRPKSLGEPDALSKSQKASAKAAAKAAGRKYPNLIDNMRAAQRKK